MIYHHCDFCFWANIHGQLFEKSKKMCPSQTPKSKKERPQESFQTYQTYIQEAFKVFEFSMTFLTSFLKTETLVMENYCPSDREELNSETYTIHKSILCLEVSVQTDSHLWMDLVQVRRQVVWAARLQESLSWLVHSSAQLTLVIKIFQWQIPLRYIKEHSREIC